MVSALLWLSPVTSAGALTLRSAARRRSRRWKNRVTNAITTVYARLYVVSGDKRENTSGTLLTHTEINKDCRDVAFEYPIRAVVNPV